MSRKGEAKELAGFPLMATSEIHDCMKALNIRIQPEDLTKPTTATTMAIWTALLDNLMGITPDMLEGPKTELLDHMTYPELYNNTLGTVMFFNHCKRLADLCRVKDFNLSDLVRPEPLRLRSVLSGIMNFAKFREERAPFYEELSQRLRAEQGRAEELQRRLDFINAEIGDIKAKREEDAPRVEEARARNEELRQHLLRLGSTQRSVSTEVERLKQERAALSQDHRSRVEEVQHLESQVQDAQARLVRSPDRMKRNLAEMERRLSEERDRKNDLDAKLRDLAGRLRVYSEIEDGIAQLNKVQREILEYLKQAERIQRGNATKRDAIRGLQNQLHEFVREAANLDRQMKHVQERFDKLAADRIKERERFELREKELSEQRAVQQAETLAAEEEAGRLEREANDYEQKTHEFVRDRERQHTELVKEWKMLEAQMDDYMATMAQKLGLPLQF